MGNQETWTWVCECVGLCNCTVHVELHHYRRMAKRGFFIARRCPVGPPQGALIIERTDDYLLYTPTPETHLEGILETVAERWREDNDFARLLQTLDKLKCRVALN
jgi:hypothetical protein